MTEVIRMHLQDEWAVARALIAHWDDRQHDIQKYGFSFLATLVGGSSVLLKLGPTTPPTQRFALVFVSLVFLVGLRVADKNYELFQRGHGASSHHAGAVLGA